MSWAGKGSRAKQQAVQKDVGVAGTVTVAPLYCGSRSIAQKTTVTSNTYILPYPFFFL